MLSSVQHPNIVQVYACLTNMVEVTPGASVALTRRQRERGADNMWAWFAQISAAPHKAGRRNPAAHPTICCPQRSAVAARTAASAWPRTAHPATGGCSPARTARASPLSTSSPWSTATGGRKGSADGLITPAYKLKRRKWGGQQGVSMAPAPWFRPMHVWSPPAPLDALRRGIPGGPGPATSFKLEHPARVPANSGARWLTRSCGRAHSIWRWGTAPSASTWWRCSRF